jgi:hypothetical protein
MARIEQKRTGWLEPMTEWIEEVENPSEIVRKGSTFG